MRIIPRLRLRNADPDDPDNFMGRDGKAGGSSVIPWMFIGMFAVAIVIGLFFGDGSPLTFAVPHVAIAPTLPVVPDTQAN